MAYCACCGEWFIPNKGHPYQKFCSRKHSQQFYHKKENERRTQKRREKLQLCLFCRTLFSPSKEHLRYCSDMCSSIAHVLNLQEQRKAAIVIEGKGQIRNCKYCGREFNTKTSGRSKFDTERCYFLFTYRHEEPQERMKVCEYCGKEFTTRISNSRACPKHVKRIHQIARRIRERNVIHEPYSRFAIYQRDQFTCHICEKPLNMDAVVPQWDSPTIDHVVALVNGGSDTPSNVKAAHFLCNSIKSNK